MNLVSRTITGAVLIILGLVLIGISFINSFIFSIYGILILIIGLFIFFNKTEDLVEPRKDLNKKSTKK